MQISRRKLDFLKDSNISLWFNEHLRKPELQINPIASLVVCNIKDKRVSFQFAKLIKFRH